MLDFDIRGWDEQKKELFKVTTINKIGHWDKDKEYIEYTNGSQQIVNNLGGTPTVFTVKPDLFSKVGMRSTGRLSLDDQMIYVGDIIELQNESKHTKESYWYPRYVVEDWGLEIHLEHIGGGLNSDSTHFSLKYRKEYKIVGNIFQNPELLPEGYTYATSKR